MDTAWLRMVRTCVWYAERPVYVGIPFDSGLGHRGGERPFFLVCKVEPIFCRLFCLDLAFSER
jgi:hypothetical protein